jgi:hypothetical protein
MIPDWLEKIHEDNDTEVKSAKAQSTKSAASQGKPRASAPVSAATSARTTASNPVAIRKEPSKAIKAPKEADLDLVETGLGISPEFEESQRQAALSSPIKGPDTRLSHSVSIDHLF